MTIENLSEKIKIIHNTNDTNTDKVMLFVPGISGEVFTSKYDILVEKCLKKGVDIVRMQSWQDMNELEEKNIQIVSEEIDTVIQYLKDKKYSSIVGVGKSFGGAMMLIRNHPSISKLILWAPAMGVVAGRSNLEEISSTKFSEMKSLSEINLDKEFLSKIAIPVRIIHGTADQSVPIDNSKKLVEMLPHAELVEIKDMDHSYKTLEEEKRVVGGIVDFV